MDLLFKIEERLFILLIYKYIAEYIFHELNLKIFAVEEDNQNFVLNEIISEIYFTIKKLIFLVYFIQKFNKEKIIINKMTIKIFISIISKKGKIRNKERK